MSLFYSKVDNYSQRINVFLTKNYKSCLDTVKFNLISRLTDKKIIALGGIRKQNLNKLKILNVSGFSGITIFK